MSASVTLCLRTDNPVAELYLYREGEKVTSMRWEAHRKLAETLHKKIDELLTSESLTMQDVAKIVVFEGPGSFTGLRIGISVGNSLAYGLKVPIVAGSGEAWADNSAPKSGDYMPVQPLYGQDPHITQQKK